MNKNAQSTSSIVFTLIIFVVIFILIASNSYINAKAVKESYCNASGPFTCKEFSVSTRETNGNNNYILIQTNNVEDITIIKDSILINSCHDAYFDADSLNSFNGEEIKVILGCDEGNLADNVQGSFELLYIKSNGDVARSNINFNIKRTQTILASFQKEIVDITKTTKEEISPVQEEKINRVSQVQEENENPPTVIVDNSNSEQVNPPTEINNINNENVNPSENPQQPEKDLIPPLVSVIYSQTNPKDNQQVTFTATASDTSGIKQIQIYVDDTINPIKTCTNTNSCTYTGNYLEGQHTYYATALDNSINPAVYPPVGNNNVVLSGGDADDVTPPKLKVSIIPLNPKDNQQVTFTATASDISGIQLTKIYVDNAIKKVCYNSTICSYVGGPYLAGAHTYYSISRDNFGNTATDPQIGVREFTVVVGACVPITEICTDLIDNDCDLFIDCLDPDCTGSSSCQPIPTQLPIIPGAKGFGIKTVAGSGRHLSTPTTTVYKITSLADSGSGTLRNCIEAIGPRTCIFETSGSISLTSVLEVKDPYITIAGQTAPSPGIFVRYKDFNVKTHDVLVQHIAFGVGDQDAKGNALLNGDGDSLGVKGSVYNVVLDHLAGVYGVDSTTVIYPSGTGPNIEIPFNVTMMNVIASYGLYDSIQYEGGPHSMGPLQGPDLKYVTLYKDMIAHDNARSPQFTGTSYGEFINNLIYNRGEEGLDMKYGCSGGSNQCNGGLLVPVIVAAVGNVFKDGPDTPLTNNQPISFTNDVEGVYPTSSIYLLDNMNNGIIPNDPWDSSIVRNAEPGNPPIDPIHKATTWTWGSGLTPLSSNQVETSVLDNVGPRPADRHQWVINLINSVVQNNGQIIDCVGRKYPSNHPTKPGQNCLKNAGGWPVYTQNNANRIDTDLDGMPDSWEDSHGSNKNLYDPAGDADGNGYTNLEGWLQSMNDDVE